MPNTININGILLDEPLEISGHREVITSKDGMDYRCTGFLVHVTGQYNPATNAYSGPPGKSNSTSLPAVTEAAIRHQLEQVRGRVIWKNGDNTVVDQSAPDVMNGPFIKAREIVECMGTRTFTVSLSFVTYMNEAQFFVGTKSPILNHRYSVNDDYDEDFYLTRNVSGNVEFRGDSLAEIPASVPDQYRSYLFYPTPLGFKLNHCHVEAESTGLTLDYSLSFVQTPIVIKAPGVVRIEASHSAICTSGSLTEAVVGAAQGFADHEETSKIVTSWIGKVVPNINHRISVRVWGYPSSSKAYLESVAWKIINWRLPPAEQLQANRPAKQGNLNSVMRHYDLMGRYVELNVQDRYGSYNVLIAQIAKNFGANPTGVNDPFKIPAFTQEDDTVFNKPPGNVLLNAWPGAIKDGVFTPAAVNPQAATPGFLNGGFQGYPKCRGEFIANLVQSAILGQNKTPPPPSGTNQALAFGKDLAPQNAPKAVKQG